MLGIEPSDFRNASLTLPNWFRPILSARSTSPWTWCWCQPVSLPHWTAGVWRMRYA